MGIAEVGKYLGRKAYDYAMVPRPAPAYTHTPRMLENIQKERQQAREAKARVQRQAPKPSTTWGAPVAQPVHRPQAPQPPKVPATAPTRKPKQQYDVTEHMRRLMP